MKLIRDKVFEWRCREINNILSYRYDNEVIKFVDFYIPKAVCNKVCRTLLNHLRIMIAIEVMNIIYQKTDGNFV